MNRRERMMADLEQDIRNHIETETRDNIDRGMSPDEARYAALRNFGNVTKVEEETREVWSFVWLEHRWQDIRYSARMLRKNPGFAAMIVLTLALGIGANTAIFSVVDALLLRPLPYRDSNRLVMVWDTNPQLGLRRNNVSPADFLDWQNQNRSFEGMAYFIDRHSNMTGTGVPQQVAIQYTSVNFFDVLGVMPILGHGFTPANGQAGNDSVVVLSAGLWKERFAASTKIVGQTIELDGKSFTIIGVAPADFDFFIPAGSQTAEHAQMWVPFVFPPEFSDRNKIGRFLTVVARLKPGVPLSQASAEMDVIGARLAAKYPDNNAGRGVSVFPIREEVSGSVRPALLILLGAVAFVLLIACANVASLFLSSAASRKREMAVRAALGASRSRIAFQLLAECVLLAVGGGTLGVFLAVWATNALLPSIPQKLLNLSAIPIDWRVLVFAGAATMLSGILFGLLPSLGAAHSGIATSLQEGGRSSSLNRRNRAIIHGALVVTEIALALVLLAGSGLLIESFIRLSRVNPGFDSGHLLTFKLSLPQKKYKDDASLIAFYREVLSRIDRLPGVRSDSMENLPPFSGFAFWGVATDVVLPGQASVPGAKLPLTAVRVIGPGYLRTMAIPLIQGREFSPAELAEERHVVIVNDAFVRKYFPQTNPIGQKITIDMKDVNIPSEIIGVVGDVHGADLTADPWPSTYWPYTELAYAQMTVIVRTDTDPLALVPPARQIVQEMDKDEPISDVVTMDQLISNSVARSRLTTWLLAVFAALAMVLACIGVYGVMAYATAQRRNEIGIRMALGAQRRDVLRLVLGQGVKLALIGVGIGVVGGLAVTRYLQSLLFNVKASDPLTFASVAMLLAIVAVAACYIPARRAMRIDPISALKYE